MSKKFSSISLIIKATNIKIAILYHVIPYEDVSETSTHQRNRNNQCWCEYWEKEHMPTAAQNVNGFNLLVNNMGYLQIKLKIDFSYDP